MRAGPARRLDRQRDHTQLPPIYGGSTRPCQVFGETAAGTDVGCSLVQLTGPRVRNRPDRGRDRASHEQRPHRSLGGHRADPLL